MQGTPELQISLDTLRQIGEQAGEKVAAFYAGFSAGFKAEAQRHGAGEKQATEEDGIPEDCKHCWCHECARFETCVVPIDGYAIESEPCPCDGCSHNRKPYMAKSAVQKL